MSNITKVVVEGTIGRQLLGISLDKHKEKETYIDEVGKLDYKEILNMVRVCKDNQQLRITIIRNNNTFETIMCVEQTIVWIGPKDIHIMSKSESSIEVLEHGVFLK